MSTVADLIAIPNAFVFDGETYPVQELDLEQQAMFQRWLEQRARDALGRDTTTPDDALKEDRRALTQDIAAGVYEWGGEVCCRALQSRSGVVRLLEIALRVDAATAARMFEAKAGELAELLGRAADEDPKAIAELLNQLGFGSGYLSNGSSTRRSTGRSKKSKKRRTPSSGKSGRR